MSEEEKRKEFNESLTAIVELANVSGNKLTKEQIRLYFSDFAEGDNEKYRFLYDYLLGLGIEIEGEKRSSEESKEQEEKPQVAGKAETEEAKAFYNMYVEDVSALGDIAADDKGKLLRNAAKGDKEAVEILTKLYLPKVMEISDEYSGSPLGKSDLVAEGNLALFEGSIEYSGSDSVEEFEKYIFQKIRRRMETAVYEELGSSRTSNHLVERINALNDASTELAKELGREADLKELSEYLAFPEEEIKELMKISIDALTIDEGKQ